MRKLLISVVAYSILSTGITTVQAYVPSPHTKAQASTPQFSNSNSDSYAVKVSGVKYDESGFIEGYFEESSGEGEKGWRTWVYFQCWTSEGGGFNGILTLQKKVKGKWKKVSKSKFDNASVRCGDESSIVEIYIEHTEKKAINIEEYRTIFSDDKKVDREFKVITYKDLTFTDFTDRYSSKACAIRGPEEKLYEALLIGDLKNIHSRAKVVLSKLESWKKLLEKDKFSLEVFSGKSNVGNLLAGVKSEIKSMKAISKAKSKSTAFSRWYDFTDAGIVTNKYSNRVREDLGMVSAEEDCG